MPLECSINFNNNNISNNTFYSGQLLAGVASIYANKLRTIKGIHIIIKGYAKVHWHQGQFKLFSDERNYVGTQIYLKGKEGCKPFILLPGVHEYPFQFQLPEQLPTSIKTNYGRIHYETILTVINPWTLNHVFIRPFKVIYPLDLNADPLYRTPIEHVSQCRCWWNISGPQIIRIKFMTKSTGFKIGTLLEFNLYVENNTNATCPTVQIKLRKFICHQTDNDEIILRGTLAEKSLGSVKRKTFRNFYDQLQIPESTSLDTGDILYIDYKNQIRIKTASLHEDLTTDIPVVLGIVPFGDNLVDVVNVIDTPL